MKIRKLRTKKFYNNKPWWLFLAPEHQGLYYKTFYRWRNKLVRFSRINITVLAHCMRVRWHLCTCVVLHSGKLSVMAAIIRLCQWNPSSVLNYKIILTIVSDDHKRTLYCKIIMTFMSALLLALASVINYDRKWCHKLKRNLRSPLWSPFIYLYREY